MIELDSILLVWKILVMHYLLSRCRKSPLYSRLLAAIMLVHLIGFREVAMDTNLHTYFISYLGSWPLLSSKAICQHSLITKGRLYMSFQFVIWTRKIWLLSRKNKLQCPLKVGLPTGNAWYFWWDPFTSEWSLKSDPRKKVFQLVWLFHVHVVVVVSSLPLINIVISCTYQMQKPLLLS